MHHRFLLGWTGRAVLAAGALWAVGLWAIDWWPFRPPTPSQSVSPEQTAIRHRLSQFQQNPPKATDTVLLGDSLTHEGEWAEWLGPGHLNRGLRGETSDGLVQRLPQTLPACPARIHLLIGTNDLHRRMALNESASARAQAVALAHARAVAAVRSRCPLANLRVQALLPVNCHLQRTAFGWTCPSGFEQDIAAVNRLLEAQARRLGLTFVDLGAGLPSSDGVLNPAFSLDGLHFNGLGYQRWVAAWKSSGW